MKLLKQTILIICLLLSVSIVQASERASISATATVIPMLGVMSQFSLTPALSVTEITDSKLLIQAPKNSTLLIHIENANKQEFSSTYLKSSSTQKNSVSDLYTVKLADTKSPQIITILTIDN